MTKRAIPSPNAATVPAKPKTKHKKQIYAYTHHTAKPSFLLVQYPDSIDLKSHLPFVFVIEISFPVDGSPHEARHCLSSPALCIVERER